MDFNYDCIPYNDINPIPTNTTEYAEMCIDYVGVPPNVDCGDGVPIPVYVDGISMNVDQPQGECDHPDDHILLAVDQHSSIFHQHKQE